MFFSPIFDLLGISALNYVMWMWAHNDAVWRWWWYGEKMRPGGAQAQQVMPQSVPPQ